MQFVVQALFRSLADSLKDQAFLSLGLLYYAAPDLIRNSSPILIQGYLYCHEYYYLTEAKPHYLACWTAYLELSVDDTSSINDISFTLGELYDSEVYDKNQ